METSTVSAAIPSAERAFRRSVIGLVHLYAYTAAWRFVSPQLVVSALASIAADACDLREGKASYQCAE